MSRLPLRRLVVQNLRRNRRHLVLAALGIIVGIASLSFFLGLGAGVRKVVLSEIFPADRLEISPPAAGLLGGLLGEVAELDEATAQSIGERPEVRAAYPKMKLAFPVRGWGGKALLGRDVALELSGFVDGVDPDLLGSEVPPPYSFKDFAAEPGGPCETSADCEKPQFCADNVGRCQLPVPALVSKFLLQLYDGSVAMAHGWPRVGDWLASSFRGTVFTVELGRSFLGDRARRGRPRRVHFQLVGVSDKAIPLGVTVPLPYVKRWNRELAGKAEASRYSSVVIRVRSKDDITPLVSFLESLGFEQVESEAQRVGLFITLVTLVLGLVSAAIVGVAALNVAHTYLMVVAERRREIGLLRALGASRAHIRALLLGEAAIVGTVGGAVGLLLAIAGAAVCDAISGAMLPDFPFKPSTYFHFSPLLCVAAVAFAVGCSLLGAWFPASRAARFDPAAALGSA